MAKKPEEIRPGLPAWQGTFGDLMNLLLCFFVLLFSMATMDAAKFEEVLLFNVNSQHIWHTFQDNL